MQIHVADIVAIVALHTGKGDPAFIQLQISDIEFGSRCTSVGTHALDVHLCLGFFGGYLHIVGVLLDDVVSTLHQQRAAVPDLQVCCPPGAGIELIGGHKLGEIAVQIQNLFAGVAEGGTDIQRAFIADQEPGGNHALCVRGSSQQDAVLGDLQLGCSLGNLLHPVNHAVGVDQHNQITALAGSNGCVGRSLQLRHQPQGISAAGCQLGVGHIGVAGIDH